MELPELSAQERHRYSRHILLPEIGEAGQRRLKAARVLCVGAGGLGSPALLYLAAAGVGTVGLVDFDAVDFTNLQRQILHDTASVGTPKIESARKRIAALNPEVRLETFNEPFSVTNAKTLVQAYDVIVDGTDNFPARYLVNDACVLYGKPNAWGSIFRFEGQASVFAAPRGPCYRCLHPEPPPADLIPNCAETGVLGVLPGIIGTVQATEVIKLILGVGDPLVGTLLMFDALKMRFRNLTLPKDPDCPICGSRPTITSLCETGSSCESQDTGESDLTPRQLRSLVDAGVALVVLDVRDPHEVAISRIAGSKAIPLAELPRRLSELNPADRIVVHCQSGRRSARAVRILKEAGFSRAVNLSGGILRWINEIDQQMTSC